MDSSHPLWQTGWYCDGHWQNGSQQYAVYNPADGSLLAEVARCRSAETHTAIAAASKAFKSWPHTTAKERSAILRRWYELMLEHQDALAELMVLEQGKPLAEAKGEVAYGASFLEWFAEEAKRAYGDTIPSPNNESRLWTIKQPVGVVAAKVSSTIPV